jgi:hypothetical protein
MPVSSVETKKESAPVAIARRSEKRITAVVYRRYVSARPEE